MRAPASRALRLSAGALSLAASILCSFSYDAPSHAATAAAAPAAAPCRDMQSMTTGDMQNMTAADMQKWVNDFYTAHAKVGTPSINAAADTFLVGSFYFDTDHNLNTQVDTMRIAVGQTVLWKLVDGAHTVTSGRPTDTTAGLLFDQPLDISHLTFSFTFTGAGVYQFFCRPHSIFGMLGVIIVGHPTDVQPLDGRVEASGFVGEPAPNPTRGGVTVQFALRTAGLARLEVFDASGRRVAQAFERQLGAGRWQAGWDGRASDGRTASAGVYYLRLQLPERVEARRLVVAH